MKDFGEEVQMYKVIWSSSQLEWQQGCVEGKVFLQRGKLVRISKWILGGMEMDMDMVVGIILRVRKCMGVVGMAKVAT